MEEWKLKQLRRRVAFGEKKYLYSENFPLISVDDNFCNMLGFSRTELFLHCRNKVKGLIYPPDFPEVSQNIVTQIDSTGEYTCRYRMRRKDGTLIWVWESGVRKRDEEGREVIYNIVVDISNEENFRKDRDTMYDNIPGGVMTLLISESNFYIVEANRQCFDMFDTPEEEYLGSSGMYTFPEDLPNLRSYIVRMAANREPIDYEFRIHRGEEKETRWFRILGRYYEEEEDGCEYLCILVDISEEKKAEFQLKREKERYRIAVGLTANSLFEYNMESRKVRVYGGLRDSDYIPCIEDGFCGTWKEVFRQNRFLYPEDFRKFEKFFRQGERLEEEVRLLARNRQTGEKSYQWYNFEATKVWENNKISRIIGSVKHLGEKEGVEFRRRELMDIFIMQASKMFEIILRIHAETGKVMGFFSEQESFQELYPKGTLRTYIQETAEQYVHEDDRERFIRSLQLTHMKEILRFGDTEEVLFFRVRSHSSNVYRHKCFRYSYFGNDTNIIIVTMQDMHHLREEQIKEEKANRKILAEALYEAQSTTEMRRNFSSMIAREIRSPLEFIQTEFQKQEGISENREELQRAASHMMDILEHMAEYERLERGQIHFQNKSFSMEDVLEKLMGKWKKRAKKCGMRIVSSMNLREKKYYGDVIHISQIVDNIIGNCLKSSRKGGEIYVWGTDEEGGEGINRFTMTFEDRGIPLEENFFGRVYPLDLETDRVVWDLATEKLGTTYSLIIARKLAEAMGGRLRLCQGEGTLNLIELNIPLQSVKGATGEAAITLSEKDEAAEVDLGKYSLLLVKEGEQENNLFAPLLKLNGAGVNIAYSVKEGIELWGSYPAGAFDAVLVEAGVSDMDYLEFAEMLRMQKKAGSGEIPIIVFADNPNPETVKAGMEMGINATLNDAMNMKRLKQVLDALCMK